MENARERGRLSDRVFRRLRDDILSERYRPGERLPSERDLSDILEVNRSSVREALKRLEQSELIRIRHGGGSTVLDFQLSAGFDLLQDLVLSSGRINLVAVRSVLEFRSLLGEGIGRYAALRIQGPELERLERIAREIESCPEGEVKRFQKIEFDFHYQMARSSENLAFILLLNSFRKIYFKHAEIFEAMLAGIVEKRFLHRKVLEALAEHDVERCGRAYSALIEEGNRAFRAAYRLPDAEGREKNS